MPPSDPIRSLLPSVRRYSVAPGILFAVPSTLQQICAYLGFKNPCLKGKVCITPTKIQRLVALGLPEPIRGAPDGWGGEEANEATKEGR